MSPPARLAQHRTLLAGLTLALATTHLGLAGLHLLDLATPVRRPGAPATLLRAVAFVDSDMWAALHAAVVALLTVGVLVPRRPQIAMTGCMLSGAVSLIWAAPLVWWSLSVTPPISLTAPVLLLLLALPVAALTAGAWIETD